MTYMENREAKQEMSPFSVGWGQKSSETKRQGYEAYWSSLGFRKEMSLASSSTI